MKLTPKLHLIIIFILLSSLVYSKNGFVEGYIITNNKDTIYGKLKDRKLGTFNKLYSRIIFINKKGKKRKYGPNDILAYRTGKYEYVSLWFLESNFFFNINVKSSENEGEKRFFKHIIKGPLNYFYLEYVEENGFIDHSGYFKRENEEVMLFVRTGIFGLNKKQVIPYFEDCKALQDKILNKSFTNPYNIANYYNEQCWKENKSSN